MPWERARGRDVATLSGGEQKRLVLEALLRGPQEVLVLDEPDNYLDVPGKTWLEERLRETPKAVLLVSHDRELLARAADRVVTLEPGAAGATAWVHGGGFATWHAAREERNARLEELHRRWDEEREKLVALVLRYKVKAAFNDGLASQYQAAQTRLRKFEEAGPPQALPQQQQVTMRLRGARTGKRAVVCERLVLQTPDGLPLVEPFDLEVWFGDRVAVLGSNGSGKSHLLRLLAAGGSDPGPEHRPVGRARRPRSATRASPGSAPGSGPAGSRRPTRRRTWRAGPCWRCCTAATSTATACRASPRAGCSTATAWPGRPSSATTCCPAGSRRASRCCCSSCPAAPCCCSTSPRTTSTWTPPRRWRRGWRRSRARCWPSPTTAGSPAASTGSSLVGTDGTVREVPEPVWDVRRVERVR